MTTSPAAVPYSSESVEIGIKDATTLPANIRGFITVGVDGTTARFVSVDSSGRQVLVGAGTAGSPTGGVVSVQGVSGGQALPISDGGGSITIDTSQLPAALVGGRLDANIGAWLGSTTPTVGQKVMAASIPVAVSSDQSAIPVSQSGTWTVQQGTPPWTVAGAAAHGSAPVGFPVLVAGYDGANVRTQLADTAGRQRVVGTVADGVAVDGDPVRVAGSDGTTTRDLLTDTGGRQVAVGAAADGAAPVGDPVLTAGYDGTNVQTELTDTAGRQRIVGAGGDGSPPVGDPVLLAGWDGTNVETLRTNSDGRIEPVLVDSSGNEVTITQDGVVYRLEITGKVSVVGALPPPSTTAVDIFADTPLTVGSHDTTWTIPSGETFRLQNITVGNEDPTKGAVTEIIFDDGTEHVVERVYTTGQSISISFPDETTARDGTTMTGNGTNTIIVRRAKYSGTNIAIDAVVRGYY